MVCNVQTRIDRRSASFGPVLHQRELHHSAASGLSAISARNGLSEFRRSHPAAFERVGRLRRQGVAI
jgi:hypothetical protein